MTGKGMTVPRSRQGEISSPVLNSFRKLEEDETSSLDRRSECLLLSSAKTEQNIKSRKSGRNLSFGSFFPLAAKRGKFNISAYGSDIGFKKKRKNSELSLNKKIREHFTGQNKEILEDRVLEDIDEACTAVRRLTMAGDEIERFEKEFVVQNKSDISSNETEASGQRRTKSLQRRSQNKNYSTYFVEKGKSSDSVFSEYDSGAYSRESTPDFSLRSDRSFTTFGISQPGIVLNRI
eukprot:GFUD01080821.1.p1 GENE.GFUD01080821.1~~GFUD01080821.1.p1  ORF type:complete len:235 (+),score=74.57 GFUD01080821.1:70-774(+)